MGRNVKNVHWDARNVQTSIFAKNAINYKIGSEVKLGTLYLRAGFAQNGNSFADTQIINRIEQIGFTHTILTYKAVNTWVKF